MTPFIGQIQPFGFNFPPRGWSLCNGQIMSIAQNTALFSLIGTAFGGDGRSTFALPDLRGRSMVHVGSGAGLSHVSWGQRGGAEIAQLSIANMPSHTHPLSSAAAQIQTTVYTTSNDEETSETGSGENALGTGGSMPSIYRESPAASTNKLGGVVTTVNGTTEGAGFGQNFNIRSPFLGIYVSIALVGIYPSRN